MNQDRLMGVIFACCFVVVFLGIGAGFRASGRMNSLEDFVGVAFILLLLLAATMLITGCGFALAHWLLK